RGQAFLLEPAQNEVVDGVARPGRVFHRRQSRPNGRLVSPVLSPCRSLIDPPCQQFFLEGGELSARPERRHALLRIFRADAANKLTVRTLARYDHLPRAILGVKTQLGLAGLFIRTVT